MDIRQTCTLDFGQPLQQEPWVDWLAQNVKDHVSINGSLNQILHNLYLCTFFF